MSSYGIDTSIYLTHLSLLVFAFGLVGAHLVGLGMRLR